MGNLCSLAVLSNFRALEKWGSCDKEHQSRKESGRETTEFLTALPIIFTALLLCVLTFKLLKPLSYAGYGWDTNSGSLQGNHTSNKFTSTCLYTWVERGSVSRATCLAQETQHKVPNQCSNPECTIP